MCPWSFLLHLLTKPRFSIVSNTELLQSERMNCVLFWCMRHQQNCQLCLSHCIFIIGDFRHAAEFAEFVDAPILFICALSKSGIEIYISQQTLTRTLLDTFTVWLLWLWLIFRLRVRKSHYYSVLFPDSLPSYFHHQLWVLSHTHNGEKKITPLAWKLSNQRREDWHFT